MKNLIPCRVVVDVDIAVEDWRLNVEEQWRADAGGAAAGSQGKYCTVAPGFADKRLKQRGYFTMWPSPKLYVEAQCRNASNSLYRLTKARDISRASGKAGDCRCPVGRDRRRQLGALVAANGGFKVGADFLD